MIPRYSRAPMTAVWSSESKFKIWLNIELYACEAMEKLGTVPKGTAVSYTHLTLPTNREV